MSDSILHNSIWLGHPKYPGYLFSPEGNCISIKREKISPAKTYKKKKGYGNFHLCVSGKIHCILSHRIIAEIFIENKDNKNQVNHINGNKLDNRVENLEWVSASENYRHARDVLGKMKPIQGSKMYNAKLMETDILKIKELGKSGMFHKDIAKIFGISREGIGSIIRGKIWKHVLDEEAGN